MDRELINKSKEILDRDLLDLEEQELLNEISLGKLTTTIFIGRMKMLTNKIKDIPMRKTLMNLGYMVYTVSLQTKTLKNMEDSLNRINLQLQKQQHDIQRLNSKK
jgi:hypothetical protein